MGMFSNDDSYISCLDCKYCQVYEKIKKLFYDDIIIDKIEKINDSKNELLQNAINLSFENNLLKKQIEVLKNENNKLRTTNR